MAEEKKILYTIVVDGETAKATIFNLTGGVKKLNIAVEDLDEVLGDMNGEMSKTTSGIGRQMASLKKQRSQVQINSKEYQNLTKSMRFYQSQMDMSTGATGSASSAAMELGRVLSDAPYGIRGVANNISQFASQMAFAAKSTGSLRLAVQDLFKALTGPLGILLAIQAVIAVFEKMSMSKQKAKEDSEDLNKALKEEIQTLEGYVNALSHSNSSLEERNGIILALISSDKKYVKSILEGNETLSEQEQAVRALLMAEKDKLSIAERRQRAEELSNGILKEELRTIEEVQIAIDTLNKRYEEAAIKSATGASAVSGYYETLLLGERNVLNALKERKEIFDSLVEDIQIPTATERGSEAWLKETISDLEKIRSKTAATSKEYKAQSTSIEVLRKQLEKLTGEQKKGKKGKRDKASLLFDTEALKKESLKYVKELMKVDEKIALLSAKDKKSRLIIQRDFHLKRLTSIYGANSELVETYKKYYRELIKTAEEGEIRLSEIELKPPRTEGADRYTIAAVRLKKASENYIQVQSSLTSFMSGEFDRQLTIEQNKTNALNNELNQRLLNENLSKDERERIQLQIGQNDEKLRKKQEQIEKKRFRMNKAANIAGALVNTAAAAAGVMAEAKGGFFARLSQALPTIAFGLAQVATIARTKFQTSAGSGGAIGAAAGRNGAGEGDSREFNFNLAGSTQSNQLTQSIASQLSQPIQTYVVSSEITTQQQLDLNIANTATIGG